MLDKTVFNRYKSNVFIKPGFKGGINAKILLDYKRTKNVGGA
jgi:hypothetical protein